jgi:hypothetical protein
LVLLIEDRAQHGAADEQQREQGERDPEPRA